MHVWMCVCTYVNARLHVVHTHTYICIHACMCELWIFVCKICMQVCMRKPHTDKQRVFVNFASQLHQDYSRTENKFTDIVSCSISESIVKQNLQKVSAYLCVEPYECTYMRLVFMDVYMYVVCVCVCVFCMCKCMIVCKICMSGLKVIWKHDQMCMAVMILTNVCISTKTVCKPTCIVCIMSSY